MSVVVECWDKPLRYRVGGRTYLDGIDVYHDFIWRDVLGHGRSQFRNGQCLALLARKHTPEGKRPALLLTTEDVAMQFRQTDTHQFLVVNLPRYLQAAPNVAESYYSQYLEVEVQRLAMMQELASDPDMIEAVLTVERVAEWFRTNPDKREDVRAELETSDRDEDEKPDLASLVTALVALRNVEMDEESLAALASFFGPDTDRARRLDLVRAITQDPDGRYVTGEVLAERTSERIADARGAMANYEALLADPATNETNMQEFIEGNLWLLGLDYARMLPRQRVLTGAVDFILERFDGFHDLLELKDPHDSIIDVDGVDDPEEAAPPPSAFRLSKALALAIGQVHAYRDRLTRHADAQNDLLGLPVTRDPYIVIVIGRSEGLGDRSRRVLTELNKSLHRVEIIPYDVLAKRASAMLDNVDHYLLAAATPTPGSVNTAS